MKAFTEQQRERRNRKAFYPVLAGYSLGILVSLAAGWHFRTINSFHDFWVGILVGVLWTSIPILWYWIMKTFRWPNLLRWIFLVPAIFLMLVGLGVTWTNLKGHWAWERCKKKWEARGVSLDVNDYIPPEVPSDQNFATSRCFSCLTLPEHHKDSYWKRYPQLKGLYYAYKIYCRYINPSNDFYGPFIIPDFKVMLHSIQLAQQTKDLASLSRNPLPPPSLPLTQAEAAQRIVSLVQSIRPVLQEFWEASRLPYARFPVNYNAENPIVIPLPHLSYLRKLSQMFWLIGTAELEIGENQLPFQLLQIDFKILETLRQEPFLVSHMTEYTIFLHTTDLIWYGLQKHRWTEEQLQSIDHFLQQMNFLEDYHYAVKAALAFNLKGIDFWMKNPRKVWEDLSRFLPWIPPPWLPIPPGKFLLAKASVAEDTLSYLFQSVDLKHQRVTKFTPPSSKTPLPSLSNNAVSLLFQCLRVYNYFPSYVRDTFLSSVAPLLPKAAFTQTRLHETRIAIAVERFWQKHKQYPSSLKELFPQYIDTHLHDVMDGNPLRYRRTPNGFVLYSIGWNEKDDQGKTALQFSSSSYNVVLSQGNWVWEQCNNPP